MLRLQVSDFGPIVEGAVVVKPLTVFIGPNNSGKSFLSVLAYALFRSLATYGSSVRTIRGERYFYHEPPFLSRTAIIGKLEQNKGLQKSLRSWTKSFIERPPQRRTQVVISELPEEVRKALEESVREAIESWVTLSFNLEFQRCYGTKIAELVRESPTQESFQLQMSEDQPH